ncbi:MAG: hypothetical protein JNL95_00430 [Chitinophagales bacterium]|nr:hypothetical protein [Chitinophagales bacterium]
MPNNVPEKYRSNYETLFATCLIKPSKYPEIDRTLDKIVANKARYQNIGDASNVPWYMVGLIHSLECNLNFNKHLHNGDPLTARTVQVPKGYPKTGTPPFTFEASAKDALSIEGLNKWGNWTIAGLLYKLEAYNGFGYYGKGINSPYLWSYSNHYIKGKYVADGKYDPNAVSLQCGVAVLLRRLRERQLIVLPDGNSLEQIKALGEKQGIMSNVFSDEGEALQILLNGVGAVLRVDGKPGQLTSNEYKNITGKYLKGDPRRV